MTDRWPALDYAADRPVIDSLHAYLQLIGKLPTRTLPWVNHGWHVALRVVPHGFRTYTLPTPTGEIEVLLDCRTGHVQIDGSGGETARFPLSGLTVADLLEMLTDSLTTLGAQIRLSGAPNEVDDAVPFAEDHRPRPWDGGTVQRCHRAFADAARVLERFRTGFVGKSSPVHLFWGSFDLAVTRFSGRSAPLHRGGVPNLPDRVTREAYSHEVASAGFWLGGGGVEEAAFYAYGYPVPDRLAECDPGHPAAYWHDTLGEFVLPYAAVRAADEPEAALLDFLEATYIAVADAGDWDRAALEIPRGRVGRPYDVAGRRID
ncbi:DUF5996 family protein [Qipengyuania sp.]|uniref:DUF5996 family protein n=1 Tax=Qipengyuania sp. TaxID=2004515 RepID=UPI003735854B